MRRRAVSLLCAFCIGAVMALVWGAVSSLLQLERLFPGGTGAKLFERRLSVQLVLYGMAGPVMEEFLFRKLLFDLTAKAVSRKWAAVIVSALFALWHGDVLQMLYAFPAGLIFQAMRQKSGGMGEPVCAHIGANLTAIAVTAFQT